MAFKDNQAGRRCSDAVAAAGRNVMAHEVDGESAVLAMVATDLDDGDTMFSVATNCNAESARRMLLAALAQMDAKEAAQRPAVPAAKEQLQ